MGRRAYIVCMTKTQQLINARLAYPSCSLTEKVSGEYRVNFKGGKEATAYYTPDLDVAFSTMHLMFLRALEMEWERKELELKFREAYLD